MVSHLDNYAVIVPGSIGYHATHLVYRLSNIQGWLAGYKPWYEEHTSSRLHAIAAAGAGAGAGAGKSELN